jgi:hypothetical protein
LGSPLSLPPQFKDCEDLCNHLIWRIDDIGVVVAQHQVAAQDASIVPSLVAFDSLGLEVA